jgi:amidase/aspartyl-tRNA(Asn)/glutamyl-tRNA(Gln) amidotransferase subunit A
VTFRDWQSLSPTDAARELHHRVRQSFSPDRQRAALASLQPEPQLADAFARADRSAPLGGVPYFLKDLFDVAGQPTRAGSTFFNEVRRTPTTDSHLVSALDRAGAVFAGKTQLHEFAYGITGENPHYGDCEHPRFPGRTTGGSSSGSAAVVAADIAPLAIGTDTGGSIRVPAAFCGLHGFRLKPRDPFIADAVPLAPSFDTAGWFTSNATDMIAMLTTLVGPANSSATPPRGCYLEPPGLEPEVAHVCRDTAARFAPPADDLTRRELLHGFAPALDAYNRIVATEGWAYHAPWFECWRSHYDPAVAQRLETGRDLPLSTVDDARAAIAAIRSLWSAFFARFDFLVLPATPFSAPTKADCTPENRRRLLTLTAPASVGGLPVLTLPVPLPSGLTTGLQLIAREPNSPVFPWALQR